MPPRQKATAEAVAIPTPVDPWRPQVGDYLNVVTALHFRKNVELLEVDDKALIVRGSTLVAPNAEIVIIPWSAIESIGVVGKR